MPCVTFSISNRFLNMKCFLFVFFATSRIQNIYSPRLRPENKTSFFLFTLSLSFRRIVDYPFRVPPSAPLYFLILYARRLYPYLSLFPSISFFLILSLPHTHTHTQRRTPPSYRIRWASHVEQDRTRRAGWPVLWPTTERTKLYLPLVWRAVP